jgi:hypothetical protein
LEDGDKARQGDRDVCEEIEAAFFVAQKTVGAESLHEPLGGAAEVVLVEFSADVAAGFADALAVELQEAFLFGIREIYVGVQHEGGEVVLGEAEAHALKVDETWLAVANNHVLGLKITMD